MLDESGPPPTRPPVWRAEPPSGQSTTGAVAEPLAGWKNALRAPFWVAAAVLVCVGALPTLNSARISDAPATSGVDPMTEPTSG